MATLMIAASRIPSAMSFVEDTFADMDGTLLQNHTGELGATWTRHPARVADFDIQSERVRSLAGVSERTLYYASGDPPGADYHATAILTWVAGPDDSEAGPTVRTNATAETHYNATLRISTAAVALGKHVAGVNVALGSWSVGTPETGTDFEVTLFANGTTIIVHVDGVERISTVDSQIASSGRVGLRAFRGAAVTDGVHVARIVAAE